MSRQLQPTSLLLIVVAVIFIAGKWAFDKGTSAPPTTGGPVSS